MKTAYICADRGVPVFGVKGCSLHVQEILRAFVTRGADVTLFTAAAPGKPPPDLQPVPVHTIRRDVINGRAAREQADLSANVDILVQLQHSGPFDLIYERYSLWNTAGMDYAQQTGVPGVLEVNAPLIDEQRKYRGLVDHAAAMKVARTCFAGASLLVAVSDGVANWLDDFPEARNKIRVIPNGVNPGRFPDKHIYNSDPDAVFTIGFVGTLKPWHGLDDLLDSFTALQQQSSGTRLLLVGDGPERENLLSRINEEHLDDVVEMTGAVSVDEIPGQLARMDVGTAPYPDDPKFYFSPLKVYEYFAAGLPVVASRIGQLDDLLIHEQNGLLHAPGDTGALTGTLLRLAHDRPLGERLGRAARNCAVNAHSWDSRLQDMLEIVMPSGNRQEKRGVI